MRTEDERAPKVDIDNWLARADLRMDITLSCACSSHGAAIPENIPGALFHITKPHTGPVRGRFHLPTLCVLNQER